MPMRIREITENEREQLHQLASCSDQAVTRRARAVLMASDGMDAGAIAQSLRVSERTVRYIVKRFNDGGAEPPSSGRPRLISEDQRKSLLAIISRSPEEYGIPTKLWNCADILAAARSEGVLGDVSYWTFRREVARILDIETDLRSCVNVRCAD